MDASEGDGDSGVHGNGHDSNHHEREMKARYDPNDRNGTIVIWIPKEIVGTHFPDLDLVTKLLPTRQPKSSSSSRSRSSSNGSLRQPQNGDNENDFLGRRRSIPMIQEITNDENGEESTSPPTTNNTTSDTNSIFGIFRPKYGFGNQYQNVFSNFEELEFLELPTPDEINEQDRMEKRMHIENAKFDIERYLSDNVPVQLRTMEGEGEERGEEEDYMLQMAINMIPFWNDLETNVESSKISSQPLSPPLETKPNKVRNNKETNESMSNLERKLAIVSIKESDPSPSSTSIHSDNLQISLTQDERNQLTQIPHISIPASLLPSSKQSLYNEPSSNETVSTTTITTNTTFSNHSNPNPASISSTTFQKSKTNILPINDIESHFLSLLDILYAFVYDHRTTDGEPTCESAWTISILSPTLSWFETYQYLPFQNHHQTNEEEKEIKTKKKKKQKNMKTTTMTTTTTTITTANSNKNQKQSEKEPKEGNKIFSNTNNKKETQQNRFQMGISQTLQHSLRRTLIYPLLRNYQLAVHCIITKDIPQILSHGRKGILKCLLRIRMIMNHSDVYYWNTKLYLNGFCVWIQMLQEMDIRNFRDLYMQVIANNVKINKERNNLEMDDLNSSCLNKDLLGLDLVELEKRYFWGEYDEDESDDEENVGEEDQYESFSTSSSESCSSDCSSDESRSDDTESSDNDTSSHTSNESMDKHLNGAFKEDCEKIGNPVVPSLDPSKSLVLPTQTRESSNKTSNALLEIEKSLDDTNHDDVLSINDLNLGNNSHGMQELTRTKIIEEIEK